MKKMKAFDFEVIKLTGPPRLNCKFITNSKDSITFFGETVEEIFEQCVKRFPEGIPTDSIVFSGTDYFDAKKNLSALLSLGFRIGYFKEIPFKEFEGEQDDI